MEEAALLLKLPSAFLPVFFSPTPPGVLPDQCFNPCYCQSQISPIPSLRDAAGARIFETFWGGPPPVPITSAPILDLFFGGLAGLA